MSFKDIDDFDDDQEPFVIDSDKPVMIRFLPNTLYGVFMCSSCGFDSGYWYNEDDDILECTECEYGYIDLVGNG